MATPNPQELPERDEQDVTGLEEKLQNLRILDGEGDRAGKSTDLGTGAKPKKGASTKKEQKEEEIDLDLIIKRSNTKNLRKVTVEVSSGKISPQSTELTFLLTIDGTDTSDTTETILSSKFPSVPFSETVELKLGRRYKFKVEVKEKSTSVKTLFTKEIVSREVLQKSEIEELKKKTTNHMSKLKLEKLEIEKAYRNKDQSYFDDVLKKEDGIMKVYTKDGNGDPGCPLNGRIKGLFFCVNLYKKGPTTISPFGSRRVIIPLTELITAESKLYFADFYCLYRDAHYVTLVVTKRGSDTDQFCTEHLVELDLNNNPFLFKKGDQFYYFHERNLWVEIMFTENIDIGPTNEDIEWADVTVTGYSIKSGNTNKNPRCRICNLYP